MIQNDTLAVARTIADVREQSRRWRALGLSVGVVPTMGSLHAGHLALIDRARAQTDRVIATIFVNPLQFGPNEDFAAYPRDSERDLAILRDHRCDAVFAPAVREMFPSGAHSIDAAATRVAVPALSDVLCGVNRPGHFDGIATIVLKLLMIVGPDRAYFGEKDYQQLQIVKRLVQDLSVPVRIEAVPIVREADGLALSSRNVYLDATQRAIAPELARTLLAVRARLGPDARLNRAALDAGRERLRQVGFDQVDYLTLASGDTLETLGVPHAHARLFAAAWLARTRLIDNMAVCGSESEPAGDISR